MPDWVHQVINYTIQGVTLGVIGIGFAKLHEKLQIVEHNGNAALTKLQNDLQTANDRLTTMSSTLASERQSSAASSSAIAAAVASTPPST